MKYLIILGIISFLPQFIFSQQPLSVKRTSHFTITGDGSASAWDLSSWVSLEQRRPGGVNYATRFKIMYSDSGIYCLFHCVDRKITATMNADFMNLWHEDVVEVFFWPDTTSVIYFEYELSPLNFELPILVPNNNGNFFGWLPWHYEGNRKVKHATQIHKTPNIDSVTGWTAEFFIPFALLRPLQNVPAVSGTRWRANFYRLDHDSGNSSWSWRPVKRTFHDYASFGEILFE